MLAESRIGAVVFFVQDLERTRSFYADVLGLAVAWADSGAEHEGRYLTATVGDATLVFFPGEDKPGRTPIIVFTVEQDDIGALVDRLAQQHVEIIAPLQHAPDGGMTADFADPDGHVLSLYQAPG